VVDLVVEWAVLGLVAEWAVLGLVVEWFLLLRRDLVVLLRADPLLEVPLDLPPVTVVLQSLLVLLPLNLADLPLPQEALLDLPQGVVVLPLQAVVLRLLAEVVLPLQAVVVLLPLDDFKEDSYRMKIKKEKKKNLNEQEERRRRKTSIS